MTFLGTGGSARQQEKSRSVKRFRRESSLGTTFALSAPKESIPDRKTLFHAQEAALSHRVADRRLSLYRVYARHLADGHLRSLDVHCEDRGDPDDASAASGRREAAPPRDRRPVPPHPATPERSRPERLRRPPEGRAGGVLPAPRESVRPSLRELTRTFRSHLPRAAASFTK